jgi:hypothetical protein
MRRLTALVGLIAALAVTTNDGERVAGISGTATGADLATVQA